MVREWSRSMERRQRERVKKLSFSIMFAWIRLWSWSSISTTTSYCNDTHMQSSPIISQERVIIFMIFFNHESLSFTFTVSHPVVQNSWSMRESVKKRAIMQGRLWVNKLLAVETQLWSCCKLQWIREKCATVIKELTANSKTLRYCGLYCTSMWGQKHFP
jgi:hypothetical protein